MTVITDQCNVSNMVPDLQASIVIPCKKDSHVHDHSFAATARTEATFHRCMGSAKALGTTGIILTVDDNLYSQVGL